MPRTTSHFRAPHAEEFVRHLHTIEVAPNGHANSEKRPLLDKGIKFILETYRSLLNFAIKRRHLSPYAENPFSVIDLDRIPIETRRPILIFSADEERQFLKQCDDWPFPIFATLAMTGMRPGELCHLLLADSICTALRQAGHERPLPMFPDSAWDIVLTWRRHLAYAQGRKWFAAATECRKELDSALHELIDQANTARQRLQETDDHPADTRLRDVYEELVALDAEFGEVEWDFREQKLSVITESIELDDMDLGPFKIVFDWSDLSTTKPYQVIALEPNSAAGDEDVTHPHVHDRTLCEGDGRVPIRNALRQDRLCDFFLLVQPVLQTYNAGSAYVRLTDWDGKSCAGCSHGFCKECLTDGDCEACRESDDETITVALLQ